MEPIKEELESTYIQLLRRMQENPVAYACEQEVKRIALADGRKAQISMKICIDEEEWV